VITLKLEETLQSAGIDTRGLARTEWPGASAGFFTLNVDGAKAISFWERLRSLTEHSGFWPLIVGEDEHLNALKDNYEMELDDVLAQKGGSGEFAPEGTGQGRSINELIARGEGLDLEGWFESRITGDPKYSQCDEGVWPVDLPSRSTRALSLTHRYNFTTGVEKPLPRVLLLLLPVTVPWHVPALVRLGGWGQCPQTEVHVAVAKHWYQRYGAEIIVATNNIIELWISKPLKTRDQSLKVAREQFIYCNDLIDRRFGTLSELASNLLDAPYWSFWWA
jgi:hypothetical protein